MLLYKNVHVLILFDLKSVFILTARFSLFKVVLKLEECLEFEKELCINVTLKGQTARSSISIPNCANKTPSGPVFV